MAELNEIYKCNICGNIVQVVSAGGGELTCCGEAMELLEPRQLEEGGAKHIPVITKEDGWWWQSNGIAATLWLPSVTVMRCPKAPGTRSLFSTTSTEACSSM